MRGFSFFFPRLKAHVLALLQTDRNTRVLTSMLRSSTKAGNDRCQDKSSRLDEAKHQYPQLQRQPS